MYKPRYNGHTNVHPQKSGDVIFCMIMIGPASKIAEECLDTIKAFTNINPKP